MEHQLAVLREIKAGRRPNTPENLLRALNVDALAQRAAANQRASVAATTEALAAETVRLAELVARREAAVTKLRNYAEKLPPAATVDSLEPPKPPSGANASSDRIARVYSISSEIAESCAAKTGVCEPAELRSIMRGLINCARQGTPMLVPKKLPSVQFLIGEGLVRVLPSDSDQLLIRLY